MLKNSIMLATLALLLAGCSNKYHERSFPVKPKELADCRFFDLQNEEGEGITVARCPNSATTMAYKQGKSTRSTVVIDGVEYTAQGEKQ